MRAFLKVFSAAIVLGVARAGAPLTSAVITKSAPVYVSNSVAPAVSYAAAPVSYAAAPVSYAAAPASYLSSAPAYLSSAGHGYVSAHGHGYLSSPAAAYVSSSPAYVAPAGYYAAKVPASALALLSTGGKPKVYSQSVPAAAIRNVETVMVTKTITPVVTKTTTHHTQAEPALSIGHVQGYSQGAVGHAKIAPVSFDTQYTTYSNPTVGINGPVVYTGVAAAPVKAVAGVAAVAPVAAAVPQPVAYRTASVYPGAALSLGSYGIDAYTVPATNFLELSSGRPVLTSGYAAHVHKK